MKICWLMVGVICLWSCMDEGKITVRNRLTNVKVESVSYGTYGLSESLMPGENSSKVTIIDKPRHWPKEHYLEFYLVGNGRSVYLKTKTKYRLEADQHLTVDIHDSLLVGNPMHN